MHIKSKDIFVTAPMSAHPSRCIYSIHNCRSIICQAPYPEIGDANLKCVLWVLRKGVPCGIILTFTYNAFLDMSFSRNILDYCSIHERCMGDFIVRNCYEKSLHTLCVATH